MAGLTDHYGLSVLSQGDSLSDDGYKYTNADRKTIDRALFLANEGHHHVGGTLAAIPTPAAPTLTRFATGGLIPAATRVYYKISLVDTDSGEGVASAEAFIDTPSAIVEPGAPSLAYATTTGSLAGGSYYYALSAYKDTSTSETKAVGTAFITVNSTTATNKITLTYPSLPGGATGFNIYRRAPGESKYFFLTSVASGPTTFVDTGAISESCDRSVPVANTTNSTNRIVVTYPGATPVVPVGYTWKIYRTYITNQYVQSFLNQVVEFTSEATPVIITFYTDVGNATRPGVPLTSIPVSHNPEPILLTDGTEVQGRMAPANAIFKSEQVFVVTGVTPLATGLAAWRFPHEQGKIIAVVAWLGRGGIANGQDDIIDVNKCPVNSSVYTTIFTTQGNRPRIASGSSIGADAIPDVTSLVKGDRITVDIDQSSNAATPTDTNLCVSIIYYAMDSTATSVTF